MSGYARAHRRLTRQSLLVTAACVPFDVLAFVVQDLPVGGWRRMVVLLAVIAADAALKTHVSSILHKLDLRDRSHAVAH